MSQIKENFITRFKDGLLVEMDFSQLEVIGLAILCNDQNLKNDLKNGIDMHCQNAMDMFPKMLPSYEDWVTEYKAGNQQITAARKIVKAFSFQLQYGAGAKSMAESVGVNEMDAQRFIDNYFTRYPRIKTWQEENIETVNSTAVISNRRTEKGYPAMVGYLESPTGRTYEFTQYDAPEFMKKRGIDTSFSPTQIKNYPVQGFSTGDCVPLAIGKVARYLIRHDLQRDILLINTIHDSILFDCVSMNTFGERPIGSNSSVNLYGALWNLREVLQSIQHDVNSLWPTVNFDIPLSVGVEIGTDWGNMTALDFDSL